MNSYPSGGASITNFVPKKDIMEPGIFFQITVTVPYQIGQIVWLQGVLGNGAFVVDDIITLEAEPSGLRWEYDFHDAAGQKVLASPGPQEITHLFVVGENRVHVTLENRNGTRSRATPMSLSIWEPCIPPTPTVTWTPLVRPTSRPLATPTATPTSTSTATASPTAQLRETQVTVATDAPAHRVTRPPLPTASHPVETTAVERGPVETVLVETASKRMVWFGLVLTGGCFWWLRRRWSS